MENPALGIFFRLLPGTIELLAASVVIAVALAAPLALAARLSRSARVLDWLMLALQSIPFFWLALALEVFAILRKMPIENPTTLFACAVSTLSLFQLPSYASYLGGAPQSTSLIEMFSSLAAIFVVRLPATIGAELVTEMVYGWQGERRLLTYALQAGDAKVFAMVAALFAVFAFVLRLVAQRTLPAATDAAIANDFGNV